MGILLTQQKIIVLKLDNNWDNFFSVYFFPLNADLHNFPTICQYLLIGDLLLNCVETCLLGNHISSYPLISLGKTRIPGVNDGLEFEQTDVSCELTCNLCTANGLYSIFPICHHIYCVNITVKLCSLIFPFHAAPTRIQWDENIAGSVCCIL